VVGIIGSTTNMPSGEAVKPGDVVRASNGKTIEIINTDAEGRLVLADLLVFAKRYNPAIAIDAATLTGAIVFGLGHNAVGVFSTDKAAADEVLAAGEAAGEPGWPMPMWDEYKRADQERRGRCEEHRWSRRPARSRRRCFFRSSSTASPSCISMWPARRIRRVISAGFPRGRPARRWARSSSSCAPARAVSVAGRSGAFGRGRWWLMAVLAGTWRCSRTVQRRRRCRPRQCPCRQRVDSVSQPDSIVQDSVARVRASRSVRQPSRPRRRHDQVAHGALRDAPPDGDHRSPAFRRDSILATGAMNLADLLDRVPGVTTYRSGWLAGIHAASYNGDGTRIRMFLDGVELDAIEPRNGGMLDLTDVQLWNLDEVLIERAPGEVRVWMRSMTVTSTTPATRVDIFTGDLNTNAFRGFLSRRWRNGMAFSSAGSRSRRSPGA
jgi:hypothetical protein